jgi:hypothetical protein
MHKSFLIKQVLLTSLALMVLGCSELEEEDIKIQLQPSETKTFSVYEYACFGGDDYLISAYAEFDEIDTNNLFGTITSSGVISRCRMKARVQLTATETATLGEHNIKIRFFYTYYDDFFEYRRSSSQIENIQITVVPKTEPNSPSP